MLHAGLRPLSAILKHHVWECAVAMLRRSVFEYDCKVQPLIQSMFEHFCEVKCEMPGLAGVTGGVQHTYRFCSIYRSRPPCLLASCL